MRGAELVSVAALSPREWTGDYTLRGGLTFRRGPLALTPALPGGATGVWDEFFQAVSLLGGSGDGVTELFIRCSDVRCAELTAVRVTVPVHNAGPVRSIRVGAAPRAPIPWRALAVGAQTSQPAQDGAHLVQVSRTAESEWRFAVVPRPNAIAAPGGTLRAEITLSTDREHPPWRRIAVKLVADVGAGHVDGGWLLESRR